MKVVGLCGQSGAGKGLVSSIFRELNVHCIDTDKVYHNIISTNSDCTHELVSFFGKAIFANPGINRKELSKLAFKSSKSLEKLNEITHRHILAEVRREIDELKRIAVVDGIIIDAPLLFESGFDKECDATVAVIADSEAKIERIIRRDGITPDQAAIRIASQIPDSELAQKCDYVIENNSGTDTLSDQVRALKKKIFD